MDKYKIIKIIGDGTFGMVSKAASVSTSEIVAIKAMKNKFGSWEECIQLREVKSLKKLIHPNIVRLKEVIRVNDVLNLVFEFVEDNLYNYGKNRNNAFKEHEIQSIIYQTLQGLSYMHKHGFFHRDMKPENLLIDPTNIIIKICDFGQAREIRSMPPYTDYISTRWYRAPECILKSTIYNSPIDIFGLGCIMAELFLMKPLFPGSSENDQLFKICSLLGSPSKEQWPDGHKLASKLGYNFPNFTPTPLSSIIPNASKDAIDLMYSMLKFDPQKRITASQALNHSFFQTYVPKTICEIDQSNNRKRTPEFSGVYNKSQEETKQHPSQNQDKQNLDSNRLLKIPNSKDIIINKDKNSNDNEMNTYNLNSSFESGSSSSSKQVRNIKDSLKNSKSQRKIPEWMHKEVINSSDIIGIGENENLTTNKIDEKDFKKYNANSILQNSEFEDIISHKKIDELNSNPPLLYQNNLPLTRLGKSKNENPILKKSINPQLENQKYLNEDGQKMLQKNYFENNECELNTFNPSQPTLSSESNFEYHKKHNISQNIFTKNQINQNYGQKPFIQSKLSMENRGLNSYIDQVSKPAITITSFFAEDPIPLGNNYNNNEIAEKGREKETDILDDFVKKHNMQNNPSSFNPNNEYNTFNYGRFNFK